MSEKNCDKYRRFRSVTVAFRMSPEEAEQLNTKVRLTGLTKQDYLIKNCMNQTLKVVCGRKVVREMRMQLEAILEELQRLDTTAEMDEELLIPLQDIIDIINADEEWKEGGGGS